jgi:hypothetical protein
VAAAATLSRFAPGQAPNGVYLSFFAVFHLALVVLVAAGIRSLPPGNARRGLAVFLALAAIAIYAQGVRVGLRDSASWRRQNDWTIERLEFHEHLVPRDLRWIFPEEQPRFRDAILPALAGWGALAGMADDRPFARSEPVRFARRCEDGLLLVPDHPLRRDMLLSIAAEPPALDGFVLEWDTGSGWSAEQSQRLAGRGGVGGYRLFFREQSETGRSDAVTRLRLASAGLQRACGGAVGADVPVTVLSRR